MSATSPFNSGVFRGNFATWQEAVSQSIPFRESQDERRAALAAHCQLYVRVKRGEVACVYDGIVLDEVKLPYALIAHLLRIGIERQGGLRVVDFGGSFGTTYFQTRLFLSVLDKIRWLSL